MGNSKNQKIVLINQVTGYLFIDIVNAFSMVYDEVILLAGEVKPMDVALNPKVRLLKITKYNKKNTLTRIISWIVGFIQIIAIINIKYRKSEVFASSNPPTLNWLPFFCSNKMSYLVYDVYPDGLVASGFIQPNGILNRIWTWVNKKSFRKYHALITLTPGMANLLSKYVSKDKIQVVPVWMNRSVSGLFKNNPENEFVKKYNLTGKFLIVYSGNLGRGYDLERLVHLAQSIKDRKDIYVLIIGEGYKKEKLELLIKELNLSNCFLIPYQPAELFLNVLGAMQVGVVALDTAAAQIAIPSKTFNIIGAGKPVISLSPVDSDLARLINSDKFGANFIEEEQDKLKDFVMKIVSDKTFYNKLAQNALKSSAKFTHKNAETICHLHIS